MPRPPKRHTNLDEGLVHTSLVSLCPEEKQNRKNEPKTNEIKLKVKPEKFRLPFESNSSVLVILENQNEFTVSYSVDANSPVALTIDPKDGCIAPGKKAHITVTRPEKTLPLQDQERLVFKVKGCSQCGNGHSQVHQHPPPKPTKPRAAPPMSDSRKRRQLPKTWNTSKKLKAFPEIEYQTYIFPTIPNEHNGNIILNRHGIEKIEPPFIGDCPKVADIQPAPVDFKLWDNIDTYCGFQGPTELVVGDGLGRNAPSYVLPWNNNGVRASPDVVDQYGRPRSTFVGESFGYNKDSPVVQSYYSNCAVRGSPGVSQNVDAWSGLEGFQFDDNSRAGSYVSEIQFPRYSEKQLGSPMVYYDKRESGCQDFTGIQKENPVKEANPPMYYDKSGCQDYTDNQRSSERQPCLTYYEKQDSGFPDYQRRPDHSMYYGKGDFQDYTVDQWHDSPKDIDYHQCEPRPNNCKAFRKRPAKDIVVDQLGMARRVARRMTSMFVPFRKTNVKPGEVKCDCNFCTKHKRPVLKIAIKNKKDSANLKEEGSASRRRKLKYALVISFLTVVAVFVVTYYEDSLIIPYFRLVEHTFWEEYMRSFRE